MNINHADYLQNIADARAAGVAEGRRTALEEAAKVADEQQDIAHRQADRADEERDANEARYLRGKATSARHIAEEIRMLVKS